MYAIVFQQKMPRKQKDPRFMHGDRVAEKPKKRMVLTYSAETKQRIQPFFTQRYGTVMATIYRSNARGSRVPYVAVLWDGSQTQSFHTQNRLCLERDLAAEVAAYNAAGE